MLLSIALCILAPIRASEGEHRMPLNIMSSEPSVLAKKITGHVNCMHIYALWHMTYGLFKHVVSYCIRRPVVDQITLEEGPLEHQAALVTSESSRDRVRDPWELKTTRETSEKTNHGHTLYFKTTTAHKHTSVYRSADRR